MCHLLSRRTSPLFPLSQVLDLTTTDPALEKLLAGESDLRSRGSTQYDVSVPEGSIVMSFEIATLATTKTCQVDVAELPLLEEMRGFYNVERGPYFTRMEVEEDEEEVAA